MKVPEHRKARKMAPGRQNSGAKTTVVVCPSVEMPAEVKVSPETGIESCSWRPEGERCGESCLPQVQFSAEELESFAARFENKPCSACGTPVTRDDWYKNRLSVVVPRGASTEAASSSASSPTLVTRDPICADCYGKHQTRA